MRASEIVIFVFAILVIAATALVATRPDYAPVVDAGPAPLIDMPPPPQHQDFAPRAACGPEVPKWVRTRPADHEPLTAFVEGRLAYVEGPQAAEIRAKFREVARRVDPTMSAYVPGWAGMTLDEKILWMSQASDR